MRLDFWERLHSGMRPDALGRLIIGLAPILCGEIYFIQSHTTHIMPFPDSCQQQFDRHTGQPRIHLERVAGGGSHFFPPSFRALGLHLSTGLT